MELSAEAVAQHASADDCWVIVGGAVYDVTEFLAQHPGGQAVLAGMGGKDATTMFESLHDLEILDEVRIIELP
jgi:L-lactate dehydrogenase (cytochrome)